MERFGRYEIIEVLGQGSMGAVYRARDPIMDRDVAIKRIVGPGVETSPAVEFRDRFFQEAKAAGRLTHPGIVTIFDVSEHEGTPFIVMEYVAGRTLQSILQSGERMGLDRVRDLGAQLAEALAYAHANGVIHRDIKPANILITNDGRLKIADFGIAKLTDSNLTVSGQLLGTPAFMSPEQFTGMPIDRRADLFAAGVVLYCMATGEKPFAGDTVLGIQYRVVHTDPLPPRKLNPATSLHLESVILKSIEKDPERRYQSGEELARHLRESDAGDPVLNPKTGDAAQTSDQTVLMMTAANDGPPKRLVTAPSVVKRRTSVLLIVLIPFLLAFIGFTTVSLVKSRQAPPASPAAVRSSNVESVGAIEAVEVVDVVDAPVPSGNLQPASSQDIPRNLVIGEADNATTIREAPAKRRTVVTAPSSRVKTGPIGRLDLSALPAPPPPNDTLLPAKEIDKAGTAKSQESEESQKSVQLLIASQGMPEPLSIIVSVDNEMLFSRTATRPPPSGFEDLTGRIRMESVPWVRLSEELALPPGKHKIQVNVLLRSQRVAKVQEVTERFYSGQPRVLQIEFLDESSTSGPEARLFKIKLR